MKQVAAGVASDFLSYTTREVDEQLPSLAKASPFLAQVEAALQARNTSHMLRRGDARDLSFLANDSVHLALTSPPYWTLKEYNSSDGQLGAISDYEKFHIELNRAWEEAFRVLVPGGRLIVVVGDVCLSRRASGRHRVVPLHADIQVNCTRIGFDNLAPIIWYKIANAAFEAEGNGGGFLGKPYEPNAVVKNDIEFILMLRKPGGYRSPSPEARLLSIIGAENHKKWFQQVWNDVKGESTRDHPAPYPIELAERLIRMFSFVGDIVIDPFCGTGSTIVAAMKAARNSVGVEIDPHYVELARSRIEASRPNLHGSRAFTVVR